MEMNESQILPVSQEIAWQALNDPDVLKQCIPGCESIERVADNEFSLSLVAAVGPVKARFQGTLQLADLDPPRAYTLAFNGQGGAAGFGKGQAKVILSADSASTTRLDSAVNAQVGGKIAQIGSRLIDGAARKLAAGFFKAFDTLLRERYPAEAGSDG
jgi:carbon monoxide dehydrogenase subunit G